MCVGEGAQRRELRRKWQKTSPSSVYQSAAAPHGDMNDAIVVVAVAKGGSGPLDPLTPPSGGGKRCCCCDAGAPARFRFELCLRLKTGDDGASSSSSPSLSSSVSASVRSEPDSMPSGLDSTLGRCIPAHHSTSVRRAALCRSGVATAGTEGPEVPCNDPGNVPWDAWDAWDACVLPTPPARAVAVTARGVGGRRTGGAFRLPK